METSTEGLGVAIGREARRRRIVDRGSDRLALITGRLQTLPNSPSSLGSAKHSHTQSSPAFFFQDQYIPPQPPSSINPSDQVHIGHKGEDGTDATPVKHDTNDGFSRVDAFDFGSKAEPQLRKCETNIRSVQAPGAETKNEAQPLLVTPNFPKASVDKEEFSKACGSQLNFFNAKEINSCIVASESTRVFCSVIIALLVVLSHINLPHNIVKSKSTIASRPLYILLLTDVTIVLVRLVEKRRAGEKVEEDEKLGSKEDGENWNGAVKILEMGLVFYQTVRAIFIDCSFYMVLVICGLSMV